MVTKFTKGPWKVFTKNDSFMCAGKIGVIEEGDCIVVADCNDWLATEKRHNAALIACAPEMYELLEQFKDFAVRQGWQHVLINEAEKLLAKARGEA
jgi:hypothetical protein